MKKRILFFVALLLVLGAGVVIFWKSSLQQEEVEEEKKEEERAEVFDISIIDTHAHLYWGQQDELGYIEAYKKAQEIVNTHGVALTVLTPHPFAASMRGFYDYQTLAKVVDDGFVFNGGGGSLNVMANATDPDRVNQEIFDRFEQQAREIAQSGAIAFGELSALHISLGEKHNFSVTSPDHPLFLLLSDIAAEEGMPMDIHMEAVAEDQPTPPALLEASSLNPSTLDGNITAFERLLNHNANAKIIWAHAGWDHTGDRTVALMRRLLEDHPNLFMSLKITDDSLESMSPLDEEGILKEEWTELLTAYADRFVVGSDQFFGSLQAQDKWSGIVTLLQQLPEDVAKKIAYQNALTLFSLNESDFVVE